MESSSRMRRTAGLSGPGSSGMNRERKSFKLSLHHCHPSICLPTFVKQKFDDYYVRYSG